MVVVWQPALSPRPPRCPGINKKTSKTIHAPGDAAVDRIKHIHAARAQILLDHNHARLRHQCVSAPLQMASQLLVRQVAQTPLRPHQAENF
ncbi:hypothetical protein MY1884_004696 [Beauveria asiatica]